MIAVKWFRKGVTRGAIVAWVVVLISAWAGAAALSDNSFLTHLATGRLILDGHLPRTDPYTFTAFGHPWVVQSWFASLLYGLGEHVGHGVGIRLMVAVLSGLLATVLWMLSRSARSLIGRFCAVLPAVIVGVVVWGERPLLFGLVGFALVLLVLVDERDPRWLVPIMWVWVNSHGSFPLGVALVVLYAIGVRLDKGSLDHPVRTLKWVSLGVLLGGINPLGPKLLWFPIELLQKQDVLRHMVEWQAPSFTNVWDRVFLVAFLAGVALMPRLPKGRTYRLSIPVLIFGALAFTASRNIALATIVLVPLLAAGLSGLGSVTSRARSRGYTVLAGVVALLTVVVVGSRLGGPSFDLTTYPTNAVDWLAGQGALNSTSRVVTRDTVGNYLEFRAGGAVPVFVDDRVDMFPRSVIDDELTLVSGGPGWERVLDRWKIDTVLWSRGQPLVSILAESPSWRLAKTFRGGDGGAGWVVYRRVSSGES